MMRRPAAIDVSELPNYAFGHRSIVWWGTNAFIVTEATVFVLAIASDLYLRQHVPHWPPATYAPPGLLWGTLNTLVMLASCVPNQLYKNAAEREDVRGVRIWLTVAFLFALAFLAVRGLEFTTLNIRWDSNAYGSIVWWLMGLHTTHIATDVADTAVLLAIILVREPRGRRFVDVSENGFYWYFVVLSWIPIYVVVYFVPRWS